MHESAAFLTVPEVANELAMTRDGVYKLIARGKLKATRLSERGMRVSRPALAAYRRRLDGHVPETRRPDARLPVSELRARFVDETGRSPEEWIADWKAERIEDSAENAALMVSALGLRHDLPGSAPTRADPAHALSGSSRPAQRS